MLVKPWQAIIYTLNEHINSQFALPLFHLKPSILRSVFWPDRSSHPDVFLTINLKGVLNNFAKFTGK